MKGFILKHRKKEWLFKLLKCILRGLPQGMNTAKWLLKITIPVSFTVLLLDYYGIIDFIAVYTAPLFRYFGLPGVAAIVLFTSIFTNVYSVILILATLALPVREGTILAAMCLVSHGFPIETAVLSKTGSSPVRMIFVRLIGSFLVAFIMNSLMPGEPSSLEFSHNIAKPEISQVLTEWIYSMIHTIVKIVILINLLNILQKILEEFGITKWLTKPLKPFIKLCGLPQTTAFGWIIANTLGLAYGSAVMISLVQDKKLSKKDADMLNHHNAISHSQLEDPLLFTTFGFSMAWLILPRLFVAILCVWLRKLELYIRRK